MKKQIAIALLAISALSGCAAPVQGVVVDKDYDPPKEEKYYKTERYSCGTEIYPVTKTVNGKTTSTTKTRTKTCQREVPAARLIKADWDLSVKDEKGQIHEVNVSEIEYNQYQLGSNFDNTK